jgi:hypothetical protein
MTFRAVLFCLFALRSSDAAVSTSQGIAVFEATSEGTTGRQMQFCERALVIPETAFGAQVSCVVAPLQTFAGIVRPARGKRAAKRNALFRTLLRAGNSKS